MIEIISFLSLCVYILSLSLNKPFVSESLSCSFLHFILPSILLFSPIPSLFSYIFLVLEFLLLLCLSSLYSSLFFSFLGLPLLITFSDFCNFFLVYPSLNPLTTVYHISTFPLTVSFHSLSNFEHLRKFSILLSILVNVTLVKKYQILGTQILMIFTLLSTG